MSYLADAIYGSYSAGSENRLSQLFAATFNASLLFRRLFLEFLGLGTAGAPRLRARPQVSLAKGGSRDQIDILLEDGNRAVVLIENKIDAPLTARQLRRYARHHRTKALHRVALVKHYFDLEVPLGWRPPRRWSELHAYLARRRDRRDHRDVDAFVIDEFLNHLEDAHMASVDRIQAGKLKGWAQAMGVLREGEPWYMSLNKSNAFQTASEYLDMLEQLVAILRTDRGTALRRCLRSVRFTPYIGVWYIGDREVPWVGLELRLRRRRAGASNIHTGIAFDTRKLDYHIITSLDNDTKDLIHPRGDLVFDRYAEKVIKHWERHLCRRR